VQAEVVVRQDGVLERTAFVYRRDADVKIKKAFGNNRATSNIYDESPPFTPTGSESLRVKTQLLVPGTILIESLRKPANLSGLPVTRTIGPVTNRLKEWALEDDSTIYGFPVSNLLGSLVTDAVTDHDMSTDCIHGVQGDIFDPDLTVIVGWFTSGFLAP
jgi:hypothetical protein